MKNSSASVQTTGNLKTIRNGDSCETVARRKEHLPALVKVAHLSSRIGALMKLGAGAGEGLALAWVHSIKEGFDRGRAQQTDHGGFG